MATAPRPAIAVLAESRYRAEALALSMSAHTEQDIFPVTELESSVLARSSTVLVEVGMNFESAIKLIRHASAGCPDATVVVLGSGESEERIAKFAEAGASGYVPANASFKEMLSIVHSARKGEFACTPDITYVLFSRLAELAQSQELMCSQASGLTIRQRQVMELLAQGLSNKEIGDCLCISAVTAKNHVHHLLTKIGVRDRRVAARLPRVPLHRPKAPMD